MLLAALVRPAYGRRELVVVDNAGRQQQPRGDEPITQVPAALAELGDRLAGDLPGHPGALDRVVRRLGQPGHDVGERRVFGDPLGLDHRLAMQPRGVRLVLGRHAASVAAGADRTYVVAWSVVWSCPFCGRTGQRTKEHVWPRWLHNYPAAKELMLGYEGERFQRREPFVEPGADGRFEVDLRPREHQNELLPAVTVSVCRGCNNGWMSRLEIAVQDVLAPMIDGEEVVISRDQQALLAAWVSKCMYAYTAEWDPTIRPWMAAEYHDMMQRREPTTRVTIWMGHSTAPIAWVGMGVVPLFWTALETPAEGVGTAPPGGASGYLAAHSVVFTALWVMPRAVGLPMWEESFERVRAGMVRVWPPSDPIGWPTPMIDEWALVRQRDLFKKLFERTAFTLQGRTAAEVEEMVTAMRNGIDPEEMHRKYGMGLAGRNPLK